MLSGLITDHLGWRWVMWINVVFVVGAVGAVLRGVANTRPLHGTRLDGWGAALATGGVSAVVLAVISSDTHAWTSGIVLGWLGAGLLCLVLFVIVESRVPDPLVPLAMLGHRSLLGATVFGFLLVSAQIASFYFVAQFLQRILGFSPTATGLAFLPFCVGVVIGLRIAMALTPRLGAAALLAAGGGVTGACGLLWFSAADTSTTFLGGILGPSLLGSIGIGASMVAMGTAAVAGVDPDRAGLASGILNSARQLGGCIGLAVLVTVAARSAGPLPDAAALAHGYGTALRWAALILAAGAVAAFLILPRQKSPVMA